jgi:hypothetical protein
MTRPTFSNVKTAAKTGGGGRLRLGTPAAERSPYGGGKILKKVKKDE